MKSKSKSKALPEDPNAIAVRCAHTEMRALSSIKPNPRNPNKHPARQIELLAKIIKHQGWRAPIVISKRSGFVVKGHGRLEAAHKLGVRSAPIDIQDYATEADELADMVADNKIAELAEIDNDELSALMRSLEGFDLTLTGFDGAELEAFLKGASEPAPPTSFPVADENIPTEHECPKCKYRWSGQPKAIKEGQDAAV